MTDSVDIFLNCFNDIENNITLDVQKHRSRYYEFDHSHKSVLSELEIVSKKAKTLSSSDEKLMKTMLINSMDIAEKKLGSSERILNIVNDSMLKLDESVKNIDATKISKNQQKRLLEWAYGTEDSDSASTETLSVSDVASSDEQLKSDSRFKMAGTAFSESDQDNTEHENSESQHSKSSGSSRRSSSRSRSSSSESESSVEPTYCICEEISYGDMVCCDNDLCPLEWFHFSCVGLTKKPKGKWYCPKCRGTNSRRMKSRKTFLKELEEYNKRKEESFK